MGEVVEKCSVGLRAAGTYRGDFMGRSCLYGFGATCWRYSCRRGRADGGGLLAGIELVFWNGKGVGCIVGCHFAW